MIRPVQRDLFAVIGNPVSHSLSPAMMNAAFTAMNVAAAYLAFQVDDADEALGLFGKMGFRGLSVTLPHKERAYRLAEKVDDAARAMGAVNTLRRNEKGFWEGINTDWSGAVQALRQVTSLQNKRAGVIGAGGVARAVVYGLKREGAQVSVSNRGAERGKALAKMFECDFVPLHELEEHRFDIVVQCTSVGMMGGASDRLVSDSFFHPGMTVMDTVYRPLWTPFLLSARKAGCFVVSGLEMLINQGAAQLEWWLERPAPVAVMREALTEALEKGEG